VRTLTLFDPAFVVPKIDPDAAAFIAQVETADGQALETSVKTAINNFVLECKIDGIWTAIQACCIMAGARTLAGALVPLKGVAPTNVGFVAGDYSRTIGLKGNGSSKYLNSNRGANADGQNDHHGAVFVTQTHTQGGSYLGSLVNSPSLNRYGHIASSDGQDIIAARSTEFFQGAGGFRTGLLGFNRASSSNFAARWNNTSTVVTSNSLVPGSGNYFVFCFNLNGSPHTYTDGRVSFYSIGSSLDLSLLNPRLITLNNAIVEALA